MQCRRCGAQNPGDARLCQNCGEPLAAPVGAELIGPPLDYTPDHIARQVLAARSAIEGERKQVTVLFCDIVESTRLAHELGPEAMHSLLQSFFKLALDQVHRFEGTVNQFLGDGFMAIFGAPIAHQDHAARAALASLALREALEAGPEVASIQGGHRLAVRIGVNSGPVVVGVIGDDLRVDYTAIGDTTNLAARLQTSAAPNEILIGASTKRSAGDTIRAEELQSIRVKGMDQPVEAYRLLAAAPFTARPMGRSPVFVGREEEMRALRTAFERARDGAGSLVHVEGEPGVGKSRLLLEFATSLGEHARVARGRCISYGNQVPNAPIADLVRDICDLHTQPDGDAVLTRIAEVLGHEGEQLDYLGVLLGTPESINVLAAVDAATVRGRTSNALRELLRTTSGKRPIVVAIEDLHWADTSSLGFLQELVEVVPGRRVLLVTTFRPGSAPPWASGDHVTHLTLRPLRDPDSESVVRGLPEAASLSGDQVQAVLDRGEGNPFFLEELTRAVVSGLEQEVPGSVEDVIAARIDRLEAPNRDVLRTASVIGREFDTGLLGAATSMNGDLPPILQRLSELGFVEPSAEDRYSFVHALTQDVTYGSMLTAQRQERHSVVARLLEETFAPATEQACEEIARHLLLGRDPDRAVPFLEMANQKAMRSHAMDEAKGFFESALQLLEARERSVENAIHRMRLLVAQWPVYHFMHLHEEYAALIERYAPLAEEVAVPEVRGPFLAQRGHRLWVFTRYAEARPTLEEALSLCRSVGDVPNAAHAQAMLQWLNVMTGNYEEADRHAHAVLETLESFDIPILRAFTPVALSLSHDFRGRWSEAIEWCERAQRVGVEMNDDGMTSFGAGWQALAHLLQGDVDAAIAVGGRAIEIAPTVYFRGWAQAFVAAAMCRTDQVHPGIEILQQVADLVRASRHDSGSLVVGLLLAEGWLHAGDLDRSGAVAAELEKWSALAGAPFIHAGAAVILGEIALLRGGIEEAHDRFGGAVEEFARIGAANGEAQALSGLGRTVAASGEVDGARPLLERALATFERLGTLGEPDHVRGALASIS